MKMFPIITSGPAWLKITLAPLSAWAWIMETDKPAEVLTEDFSKDLKTLGISEESVINELESCDFNHQDSDARAMALSLYIFPSLAAMFDFVQSDHDFGRVTLESFEYVVHSQAE